MEAVLPQLPERVDVLVNSAGSRELAVGAGPHGLLARWRGDFERNVLTAVLLTESLRDRFTDGGRVVTVTSVAALRGGGSYGASKAALHAWNHSLAAQLGPQGVTCNIVAPGTVAGTEFFGSRLNDAELTRRAGRTLVGRVGRPGGRGGGRALPRLSRVGLHHRRDPPVQRRRTARPLIRAVPVAAATVTAPVPLLPEE